MASGSRCTDCSPVRAVGVCQADCSALPVVASGGCGASALPVRGRADARGDLPRGVLPRVDFRGRV